MKTRRITYRILAVFALLIAAAVGLSLHSSGQAYQETATSTPTVAVTTPDAPTAFPTNTPRPTLTPSIPAPTLVPPTPLPTMTPTPFEPPTMSGLAVAQSMGELRVGTYYNAFPFTWLNEYGELVGYEVDIIRAIAIELGVEVEFAQVTRQNADSMLLGERVDLLIGQQVHARDREDWLDFSHPYSTRSVWWCAVTRPITRWPRWPDSRSALRSAAAASAP
jgi:ABC-type amino acid transport substrate-binding protein